MPPTDPTPTNERPAMSDLNTRFLGTMWGYLCGIALGVGLAPPPDNGTKNLLVIVGFVALGGMVGRIWGETMCLAKRDERADTESRTAPVCSESKGRKP
jgi:hypothetical protein